MADNQLEKSVIDKILEITNLDPIGLADILGVTKEYIYMLQSGKRGISKQLANKILNNFNIPIEFSMGDVNDFEEIKVDKDVISKLKNLKEIKSSGQLTKLNKGVPFYDFDVTATITGSFLDTTEKPEYFVDFMPFNDCDAFTRVYGDSMYPKYASGEIIAIKRITNIDGLLWGEAYLVVTDGFYDDLRTIKLVHQNKEDPSTIILRASNPNFAGDTIIKKNHILGLFKVKGKTRIDQM